MIARRSQRPRMNAAEPIRREDDSASLSVRNSATEIEAAQAHIVEAAARHGYPKASVFALRLAIQEAISNAFRHGHRNLPADLPITVEFAVTNADVRVTIEDRGPGFDPTSIPDPTLEPNLEATSGRGLFLIKAYMAEVTYSPKGNRVDMVYRNPTA